MKFRKRGESRDRKEFKSLKCVLFVVSWFESSKKEEGEELTLSVVKVGKVKVKKVVGLFQKPKESKGVSRLSALEKESRHVMTLFWENNRKIGKQSWFNPSKWWRISLRNSSSDLFRRHCFKVEIDFRRQPIPGKGFKPFGSCKITGTHLPIEIFS